ncbi:transporter [Bacteroidia bacterium]|nr:transporter [Bacteroidia bacterium]
MIVEFTVGNFLSFNEKRTISFKARGGVSELKENIGKNKLLRSLVIYGANSSGKSNLIKALARMSYCVFQSIKLNFSDKLDYSPFLLSKESINQPTFFEIVFLTEKQRFRYGFEYNLTEIVNEWLFAGNSPKTEKPLFIRTLEGIGLSDSFKEGKGLEGKTNENRLFLSKVADENGEIAKQVMDCFFNYNVLSGIEHDEYGGFSLKMFDLQSKGCKESLDLFKKLQLGFNNIEIIETDFKPADLPKNIPVNLKSKIIKDFSGTKAMSLNTIHNVYDKQGKVVANISWEQEEHESEGTKKIMDFSGPLFDTLAKGKTLVIDELDAKLHPLITMYIVSLFNNPNTNSNNAQLLFATHDTNLLNVFRRDQIWFAEKDAVEQTDLYSIDDFVFPDGTKVRKDANLERNYIRGRYGAIPFITNF